MSTRACVAIGTPSFFTGVYSHRGGYPTVLGKAVWDHLQADFVRDAGGSAHLKERLREFAEALLSFGDWREYLNDGVCEYCGKRGLGQPCSISGMIVLPPFSSSFGSHHDEETMRAYYVSLPTWRNRLDDVERMVELSKAIAANVERTGYRDPDILYHSHVPKDEAQMTQETADPIYIEWVYLVDPKSLGFYVLASTGSQYVKMGDFDLRDLEPNWEALQEE